MEARRVELRHRVPVRARDRRGRLRVDVPPRRASAAHADAGVSPPVLRAGDRAAPARRASRGAQAGARAARRPEHRGRSAPAVVRGPARSGSELPHDRAQAGDRVGRRHDRSRREPHEGRARGGARLRDRPDRGARGLARHGCLRVHGSGLRAVGSAVRRLRARQLLADPGEHRHCATRVRRRAAAAARAAKPRQAQRRARGPLLPQPAGAPLRLCARSTPTRAPCESRRSTMRTCGCSIHIRGCRAPSSDRGRSCVRRIRRLEALTPGSE